MAALIQDDLAALGMKVNVAPLEFRSLVDRVLNTKQYEAAILGLGGGDADPNSDLHVWLSSGGSHVWNPGQKQPATPWEAEVDRLMTDQVTTLDPAKRRMQFHRVQEILFQQAPMIFLASPNVLVAARKQVGNFRPAVLDHYTLRNVEQIFIRR